MSTDKPLSPTAAPSLPEKQGDAAPRRRRKLSAIMMADVSGFSRMMGEDEEGTVALIREFHQRVHALVVDFEGRIVSTAGDSLFGEFDSVVNAVRCARRIQEELVEVNSKRGDAAAIKIRIGVHLGDVIVEDYSVYGDGVNIAARLEPLADPGGICFSEAVYQQIRNKLDLPVEDLGLKELKNIEHPIRIYKVPPLPDRIPIVKPTAVTVVGAHTATIAPTTEPELARQSDTTDGTRGSEGQIEEVFQSWFNDIIRAGRLIPLIVGLFLLLSPAVLFHTGGIFPTAGAILISTVLGRVWAVRSGREGYTPVALGVGIAAGALLTNWSPITNTLFVLVGLIVAAAGFAGAEAGRRNAPSADKH